jgi:hypothetical protein
MARGRLLSRTLGSSRKFAELHGRSGRLGDFAQALYPLIVACSDDFGRMAGDAFSVKFEAFPTSPHKEADFETALSHMADVGLILRYTVDGKQCLQIVDFEAHQVNLHKRTRSRIPSPPGVSDDLPEVPGKSDDAPEIQGRARAQNRTEPKRNEPNRNSDLDNDRSDSPPKRTAARMRPSGRQGPTFEISESDFDSLFERIREVTGEDDTKAKRALYRHYAEHLGVGGFEQALSSTKARKLDRSQSPLRSAGAYLNKACQDIARERGIVLGRDAA